MKGLSDFRSTVFKGLFHPLTVALIISIVSAAFIFPKFEKYKIETVYEYPKNLSWSVNCSRYLVNFDGAFEHIELVNSTETKPANYYFPTNTYSTDKTSHQFIIKGEWLRHRRIIVGDYNSNKRRELYTFHYYQNAIYLNIQEDFKNEAFVRENVFLDSIKPFVDDKYDIHLVGGILKDINKDGYKDFLFVLHAGYSKFPRRFYVYDIYNNKIQKSVKAGFGPIYIVEFKDVNDDGFPEVVGASGSIKNYHQPILYSDSISWVMVYSKDAQFLFPPKPLSAEQKIVETYFVEFNRKNYMFSFSYVDNKKDSLEYFFVLHDIEGNEVKKKVVGVKKNERFFFSDHVDAKKQPILIKNTGQLYSLDFDLNLLQKNNRINLGENKKINFSRRGRCDLNNNGKPEYFVSNDKKEIFILSDDFRDLTHVGTGAKSFDELNFWVNQISAEKTVFGLNFLDEYKEFSYIKNPYRWLKFPLVVLVFLFSYLVMFFILKVQKQQIENKIKEQKQIQKFQYRGLRNQLDPHFSLNILNAIQSLFYQQDFERAKKLLIRYGKLNRIALQNAEKIAISLEDELEFVENYIAIESFRQEGLFEYKLEVSKEINVQEVMLPRMLVHTFVENAIKHGLRPKKEKGFLKIQVSRVLPKGIVIYIEDTGVGREKSRELKTRSTGKGLYIIGEILKLYNKLYRVQITYRTVDLYTEEKPTGTRIEIIIPEK